jgi:hypothetical protein
MALIYEFSDSSNWQYVGQQTLTRPSSSLNGLTTVGFIADTAFPILLTSPIIAVSVRATDEKETWNYAGMAFQQIFTGITVGGNFDSYIDSQSLFFKKVNVIRFNRLNTSYALVFRPAKWVSSLTYTVFAYTGPIVDTTQIKLDQILQELQAS